MIIFLTVPKTIFAILKRNSDLARCKKKIKNPTVESLKSDDTRPVIGLPFYFSNYNNETDNYIDKVR